MNILAGTEVVMQIPVELSEQDVNRVRYVLDSIKEKLPWERDERLIMMAINRLYIDMVDPEISGEPLTPEQREEILKKQALETPEQKERTRQGLLAMFAKAGFEIPTT